MTCRNQKDDVQRSPHWNGGNIYIDTKKHTKKKKDTNETL